MRPETESSAKASRRVHGAWAVVMRVLIWLPFAHAVSAQEVIPPSSSGQGLGQAQGLNQANRQALDRMHKRAGPGLDPALQRQQQGQQRALQEQQRRELLWQNRGAGASNRTPSQRQLQGVHRQRQHQSQQRYQLNRLQRQIRPYSNRSR